MGECQPPIHNLTVIAQPRRAASLESLPSAVSEKSFL